MRACADASPTDCCADRSTANGCATDCRAADRCATDSRFFFVVIRRIVRGFIVFVVSSRYSDSDKARGNQHTRRDQHSRADGNAAGAASHCRA